MEVVNPTVFGEHPPSDVKITNSDSPFHPRKLRKDGTTRKARIFGRPYWYERAGWSEEKSNERRAIVKDRVQAKWPDWSAFNQIPVRNQEIQDWIKPVVVTFDDDSWCLPNSSSEERLQEQLSIYSEWAKHILRVTNRSSNYNTQPELDQTAMSTTGRTPRSPSSVATPMRYSETPVGSRYSSFTPVNMGTARSCGTEGGKDNAVLDEAGANALATTWNFSTQSGPDAKNANGYRRQSDNRSKPPSFTTPSRVERNTSSAMPEDYSDNEGTEATEVSDSEPARQISDKIIPVASAQANRNNGSKAVRKWRDIDWDDVVVTIDATNLVGESFPIPMTLLKPGSTRSLCRWDDFELHDLYARLEIEAGQKIDWAKYMIVSMVNSNAIAINTPGKYKLLLKEYSKKTRPSSATVLFLRLRERIGFAEVKRRGPVQRTQLHDQGKKAEKRSQFTGAPSDFSSDSDTEPTPPPAKRQKRIEIHQPMSASRSESIVGRFFQLPSDALVEQPEQSPAITAEKRIKELKIRQYPEDFTQDTNAVT